MNKLLVAVMFLWFSLAGCVGVMKDRTRVVTGPAEVHVGSVSTPWGSLPAWDVKMETGSYFIAAGKDTDLQAVAKVVKSTKPSTP